MRPGVMKISKLGSCVDIMLLVSIAFLTSMIMQLSMYLFGAMVCEYMGLQAENTFCQIYFDVNYALFAPLQVLPVSLSFTPGVPYQSIGRSSFFPSMHDDSLSMKNISWTKPWCLLWNHGKDGPRGMRCLRRDSLLALFNRKHARAPRGARKRRTSRKAAAKTKVAKTSPNPKMPETNLQEMRENLPLIKLRDKSLTPRIWINRHRQNVDLIMALSIYKFVDSDDHPLFTTLDTLFFNIPPPGHHRYLVMVFITEIMDDFYVEQLVSQMMKRYYVQIETGLLEILAPREKFYTSMFTPKSDAYNDKMKKIKKQHRFRRKQCMDLIFMMIMAHQRGKYYLQLGHNVLTRQGFLSTIDRTIEEYQSQNWTVLSFADSGLIGKVVHSYDLLGITTYLSRLNMNKPADYHIDNFVRDKSCGSKMSEMCDAGSSPEQFMRSKDTLMQYIKPNVTLHAKSKFEKQSSLVPNQNKAKEGSGKTILHGTSWVSVSFNSKIIKNYLPCSTIRFTQNILPLLSSGETFLHVSEATRHERISIGFNPPLRVFRVRLATGLPGSGKHSVGADSTVWSFSEKLKMFSRVGNFDRFGNFEMNMDRDLREIHVLEIMLGSGLAHQDIFLREVSLAMICKQSTRLSLSSTTDIKPTNGPPWYTPAPPTHTPRREGPVLISY